MCNEREQLVAYLYDEADASERRAVEAHLAECDACRDELRAFRGVREDLLAWDVPPHESVWKPFVTAKPAPVWRQMPAWSLAAAATLVFAIGGAGGFAARAVAARLSPPVEAPATTQASNAPAASPAADQAMSVSELRAIGARLDELERAANTRPTAAAVSTSTPADAALLARVEQLIRESEGRLTRTTTQKLVSIIQDLGNAQKADKALLQQQISETQEQINRNILRVMNTRSPEKEQ